MAVGDFDLRRVRVRPARSEEIPPALLRAAGGCGARCAEVGGEARLRLAWLDVEAVAVYLLAAREAMRHEIVMLIVREDQRGRGLGRWMLRHAVAVGESRGARMIEAVTADGAGRRFLEANGFRPFAADEAEGATRLRLELTPE